MSSDISTKTRQRALSRSQRQAAYHQERLATAPSPRRRLQYAVQWLVAEAWRAEQIEAVTRLVVGAIESIRADGIQREANDGDSE
jgi:ribosomal protein S7